MEILESNPSPQMCYQVGFCFWLMTFETEVAEQINRKFDIVPLLMSIAQGVVKEKVQRVIVATYRVRLTLTRGTKRELTLM